MSTRSLSHARFPHPDPPPLAGEGARSAGCSGSPSPASGGGWGWRRGAAGLAAAFLLTLPVAAGAAEEPERTIAIEQHRFVPPVVEVPAGMRVKLIVDNRDPTPEEFESTDLRREKVIVGHSQGIVWVGPLPPGEYKFFGDFHQDTAQGKLVAK